MKISLEGTEAMNPRAKIHKCFDMLIENGYKSLHISTGVKEDVRDGES